MRRNYIILMLVAMSGCATMLTSSDWKRFENGSTSVCDKYSGFDKTKCTADYKSYSKAKKSCEISSKHFGANPDNCINRNRAIWVLYEDNFSYSLRKRKYRTGIDFTDKEYMSLADKWQPKCLDAKGNAVSCK